MKLAFVIIAAWLVSLALSGCSTTRVKPISLLSEYSKATFYQDVPSPPRETREVAVDQLTPILARATWTNKTYIHKGGFWLRFPNGRELFVPIAFEFFRERDVPGTFLIRPEDFAVYRRAVEQVRQAARNPRN